MVYSLVTIRGLHPFLTSLPLHSQYALVIAPQNLMWFLLLTRKTYSRFPVLAQNRPNLAMPHSLIYLFRGYLQLAEFAVMALNVGFPFCGRVAFYCSCPDPSICSDLSGQSVQTRTICTWLQKYESTQTHPLASEAHLLTAYLIIRVLTTFTYPNSYLPFLSNICPSVMIPDRLPWSLHSPPLQGSGQVQRY